MAAADSLIYGGAQWESWLRGWAGRAFAVPAAGHKFMLIVEPRRHAYLPWVVSNFACQLCPLGWGLVVAHGSDNGEWLRSHPDFCPTASSRPNIRWLDLGVPNLSIKTYNALFLDREFWKRVRGVGAREVLVFQTDTLLLDGARLDREYANGRFDYVGAPWRKSYLGCRVGNGGLSLRRVSKMIEYCQWIHRNRSTMMPRIKNEDVLFSIAAARDESARVPGVEAASGFSVETWMHDPAPCGLHKPLGSSLADRILPLLARRGLAAEPKRATSKVEWLCKDESRCHAK